LKENNQREKSIEACDAPPVKESGNGKESKKKLSRLIPVIMLILILALSTAFWFGHTKLNIAEKMPVKDPGGKELITITIEDGASNIHTYNRAPHSPDYPHHMPVLTLSGSWDEMGRQYGRGCAGYISAVFDGLYREWDEKPFGIKYLKKCLGKFDKQIRAFSPEMRDFLKGISEGAADSLNRSQYSGHLTNYEKILFLNVASEMTKYDRWHEKLSGRKFSFQKKKKKNENRFDRPSGTCWAALPNTTSSGELITGLNRDMKYFPAIYQAAIRAYPAEKDSIPFTMTLTAGLAGADNNLNREGLFIGRTRVGDEYRPEDGVEEIDFGVPAGIVSAYIISHCKTVDEAKEILTRGTNKYRSETGRKTLLHSCGMNYLAARKNRAIIIERSAHHYAFRYPGNMKELNSSYIATANHFTSSTSFDENGVESYTPMKKFGRSQGGRNAGDTEARLNSALHQLRVYHKRMNLMLGSRELCSLTSYFDEEQIERTKVKLDGKQVSARGVGWTIDNKIPDSDAPVGGTIASHVNLPKRGETHFVLGSPSDWFGKWDVLFIRREKGPDVLPGME